MVAVDRCIDRFITKSAAPPICLAPVTDGWSSAAQAAGWSKPHCHPAVLLQDTIVHLGPRTCLNLQLNRSVKRTFFSIVLCSFIENNIWHLNFCLNVSAGFKAETVREVSTAWSIYRVKYLAQEVSSTRILYEASSNEAFQVAVSGSPVGSCELLSFNLKLSSLSRFAEISLEGFFVPKKYFPRSPSR